MLNIFLKIIHGRIYAKLGENKGNRQFGFRNSFGTRDALYYLNILVHRMQEINYNVCTCFIDFQKAFNTVKHNKLIEILQNTGYWIIKESE